MARKKPSKWIQRAVKNPGALTKQAKAAGAYHNGKIDLDWLQAQAKKGGKTGRRARLAMTLRKLGRRRAK